MKKLLKKTKLVKQILQEVPITRRGDGYLVIEYFKRIGISPDTPFDMLVATGYFSDIQTISRIRRKIQEQFPDLRDLKYYEGCKAQEQKYVDYALNMDKQLINNYCEGTDNGSNLSD